MMFLILLLSILPIATFKTASEELDNKFVEGAKELGLVNLKGHRLTGGIRASIYNAMPLEGVEKLRDYMLSFEKRNTKY